MRAQFTTDGDGNVLLAYDDVGYNGTTQRVIRWFTCPAPGGRVMERLFGEWGWQYPCVKLLSHGAPLICDSRRGYLLACIRREYQALRRAEKREARLEGGVK